MKRRVKLDRGNTAIVRPHCYNLEDSMLFTLSWGGRSLSISYESTQRSIGKDGEKGVVTLCLRANSTKKKKKCKSPQASFAPVLNLSICKQYGPIIPLTSFHFWLTCTSTIFFSTLFSKESNSLSPPLPSYAPFTSPTPFLHPLLLIFPH